MLSSHQIPHRIRKKLAPGLYNVAHPMHRDGSRSCQCDFAISPPHARHVTYLIATGIATCNHCRHADILPCPAVRTHLWSNEVYMDLGAIQDDLIAFSRQHESCPQNDSTASPPPSHDQTPHSTDTYCHSTPGHAAAAETYPDKQDR